MLRSTRGELGPRETAVLRRLVLASSGVVDEPEEVAPVVWRRLLDSAERHRLAPLVLEGARRSGELPRMPAEAVDRLQNLRNLELAKAVVRLHHLDELGAVAFRRGWDLYLLKGAFFATALYSHPGNRPMSDIDVLIDPMRFADWTRELEALGYAIIDSSDHACCFRRGQSGVLVEIHRALTSAASYLGLSTDRLRERSVAVESGPGVRLRTLSWEDHLLHLSLHASFQHGFRQPGVNAWDARSISERPDFDLSSFVERARAPRLASWVFGGLAMAASIFETPRLRQALAELAEGLPARYVRRARNFRPERLLAPGPEAVFGAPFGRLGWSGFRWTTWSLLMEMSRPRLEGAPRGAGPSLSRIWQLFRHHGLAALESASTRRSPRTLSPSPASLREVRDV